MCMAGRRRRAMKMDALAKTPTFDGKAKLEGMNLANLNNFIDAFAKFDIKSRRNQLLYRSGCQGVAKLPVTPNRLSRT